MQEPPIIPPDDLMELCLFPLSNVVLFPKMHLPLHIFEERYKNMIRACINEQQPFGVLLIRQGQEVGEPAEPFKIGTTARITKVQELQEGRLNISTEGERRFELVHTSQTLPYMTGLIRYVNNDGEPVSDSLITSVKTEFRLFLSHQATIAGGWNSNITLPDDPDELLAQVISGISSSIEIPTELRQRLLETDRYAQRLEKLVPILQKGNEIMREQSEKTNPFQGNRLN